MPNLDSAEFTYSETGVRAMLVVLSLAAATLSVGSVRTADGSPLPEPLTLDVALAVGTESTHPVLLAAQAEASAAEAMLEDAESNYELESSVNFRAGWVQPNALALDQTHDDNLAQLNVRKVLYDFGVTSGRVGSAENLIVASRLEYQATRQRQVIDIARHYFEVLLADLRYVWDNENLAMEYVQYDRVRERHALKQLSDIELLRSENAYQAALTLRRASETAQRTSRVLLAVAINRPGELSAELARPALPLAGWVLPELDELVASAISGNADIQAVRKRENATQLALETARQRIRPTLDATLEVSEYSRKTPGNDDARARINLVIPLIESGGQRSDIATKRAQWLHASAQVLQMESELRRQVAETWRRLLQLQTRRQELEVAIARAELELDRARGEYELEMKTSLGSAMVDISRVRYERAQNDYETALAWMNLQLLLGRDPQEILTAKVDTR